jgi:hypothetical protein
MKKIDTIYPTILESKNPYTVFWCCVKGIVGLYIKRFVPFIALGNDQIYTERCRGVTVGINSRL